MTNLPFHKSDIKGDTEMPLNVELLQKVKAHILAEPRRLDMSIGASKASQVVEKAGFPPCGTVACIAGWSAIFCGAITQEKLNEQAEYGMGEISWGTLEAEAVKALGLTGQSNRLFYWKYWPEEFKKRYAVAVTREQVAKVTADRIDHLIATGE